MKLENLDFKYGDKNPGEFSSLWYKFSMSIENQNTKEKLGEKFKHYFGVLEKYLDNGFSNSETIKSREEQATNHSLTKGFCYRGESFTATLNYQLSMINDVIQDISIHLHHMRDSEHELLDLYDAILDIPKLELSEGSKSSTRKIDCLRKGKDLGEKLLLLTE